MKSTAAWEREDLETIGAAPQDENDDLTLAGSNFTSLRELTFKLLRQVESIGDVHTPDIESGIDFYDEVSRFEIDLIKRALVQTGGHQRRAARLLNLRVTTLNSKIKHYNIRLVDSVCRYSLADTNEMETRRRA
jgi:transcriptional regulator with GAF, ATPase, and Fis domain